MTMYRCNRKLGHSYDVFSQQYVTIDISIEMIRENTINVNLTKFEIIYNFKKMA